MSLNETYWSERYKNNQTGWDIGYASPAIINYFSSIKHKNVHILIPGGGNGYEAEALYKMGFENLYLLDITDEPLLNFAGRNADFPKKQLLKEDFFMHSGQYDYIIEQTFFCALKPDLRRQYVEKMSELLKPDGILVGLLFNRVFDKNGPPFGGTQSDYLTLFEDHFKVLTISESAESIPERLRHELFIELQPLEI